MLDIRRTRQEERQFRNIPDISLRAAGHGKGQMSGAFWLLIGSCALRATGIFGHILPACAVAIALALLLVAAATPGLFERLPGRRHDDKRA